MQQYKNVQLRNALASNYNKTHQQQPIIYDKTIQDDRWTLVWAENLRTCENWQQKWQKVLKSK